MWEETTSSAPHQDKLFLWRDAMRWRLPLGSKGGQGKWDEGEFKISPMKPVEYFFKKTRLFSKSIMQLMMPHSWGKTTLLHKSVLPTTMIFLLSVFQRKSIQYPKKFTRKLWLKSKSLTRFCSKSDNGLKTNIKPLHKGISNLLLMRSFMLTALTIFSKILKTFLFHSLFHIRTRKTVELLCRKAFRKKCLLPFMARTIPKEIL